ncbi:MAG: DUF1622 domain-containing protein [Ruminococcus sp.]|nr:DUF1622 domain-containing protein [Ruminococcus sp.]
MNFLHEFIEKILPFMISFLEIIGIFVVFWSGIHGFWQYFMNTFMKKEFDLQTNLAKGLAMGLEFKMAAEILRTVLIQSLDELYMLGAVILLRALLSLLIHYEIKHPRKEKNGAMKKTTQEEKSDE